MEIGLPTDVKHVAHIGWDGPSVNSPSWVFFFFFPFFDFLFFVESMELYYHFVNLVTYSHRHACFMIIMFNLYHVVASMQMNEFKPPHGYSSAPLGLTGDINDDQNCVQWASEGNIKHENENHVLFLVCKLTEMLLHLHTFNNICT